MTRFGFGFGLLGFFCLFCQIINPVASWKCGIFHLYEKVSGELNRCHPTWSAALPAGVQLSPQAQAQPPGPRVGPRAMLEASLVSQHLPRPFKLPLTLISLGCFNPWSPSPSPCLWTPLPLFSIVFFCSSPGQPLPSRPQAEGDEDFLLR